MTSLLPLHSPLSPAVHGGCINKTRTRVLIIDNHELVRHGLAALLNAEDDMMSCGEMPCTEAAVDEVLHLQPDVVIVDVSASGGAGLQVIQRVRKANTNIRIVALAMSDKPEFVERVFSAGAAAFVVKTDLAARVLEAIRRNLTAAAVGAAGVGERERGRGRATRVSGARPSDRCLDAVEREIVEMIGRGVPTRAIAVRVGMSVAMVEAYRRRIRSKLNFPTACQLVQFCVRWAERARLPALHRQG